MPLLGQAVSNRPTQPNPQQEPGEQKAMTDDLIFLKAAGGLVLLYNVFRGWQRYKARKSASNDPWSGIEHR